MKKFTLLLLFLSLSFACSNDDDSKETPCTTEVVPGLEILVTDAQNIPVTEGITVVAIDGSYSEELNTVPVENIYNGAFERAGTYTIIITGTGYKTYTSEPITVEADRCHVVTQKTTVQLDDAAE